MKNSHLLIIGMGAYLISPLAFGASTAPSLSFSLAGLEDPDAAVPALKIVAALTVLSMAPAVLLLMTSFTRILIVLGFIRQALGTQTLPPNQVLIGLALFLTFFTMAPMLETIEKTALTPYMEKKITQSQAIDALIIPVKKFMQSETRQEDLLLFTELARQKKPTSLAEISLPVLMPAFLISELKSAFQMGFLLYIPFLIIDMVVASILMSMGMMMLPPTVVSLPFKLVLFVLVDGWNLIISSLVRSFHIFSGA